MLVDRAWAQVDSSDEETDSEASDVEELPGPEEISQKTLDVEVEEDDLDYEFTINDPDQFMEPWTVSLPLIKGTRYFEYACHEGNYGMTNILSGHRAEEDKK